NQKETVMKQTFERIEKHLYKRQYQTAGGNWSTVYYAKFVCWDDERRTFPVGENLGDARDELGRLRQLNKGRYPWAAEKAERKKAKVKALTLTEYLDKTYLPLMLNTASHSTKTAQAAHLKRLLGSLP